MGYCKKEIKELLAEFKKPPSVQRDYVEITKTDKIRLLDFIKQDRPEYYGITYFLIRLGWRIDETLSVQKKNVKLNGLRPIAVKLEKDFRKNKRDFVLETIDDGLAVIIQRYLFKDKESKWLFPSSRGNKISSNNYREYLAKISQELLGKRLHPHLFRHSFVVQAALAGMPIRDVMAITGHLDIDVVLKYYSHSTSQGREKVLAISEI
ncbi:MAG: hypothetical protein A2243_11825 [Omnitrophica WOR_2 bacterium RIFOXYA2_FULL_38_17]|nr:MAG: hypothetical protein A2243_11825 [Omnitrophica WOR_2 bacterium RIFOXYA2_FULL_38_17]